MPPNPERPNAPRSGPACHLYGEVEVTLTSFPVPATGDLPSVPRVAVSYPTTELRHLPLSTATPITAGPTARHKRARHIPYLAFTRPSNVRDYCSAVAWDKRRGSDIGSHVGPMFQTAVGRLPHLATRPQSNLDHCASLPTSFGEIAIPVSDGHLLILPGLLLQDGASCLNTVKGGPISPKLRWSGAGEATPLDALGGTHL